MYELNVLLNLAFWYEHVNQNKQAGSYLDEALVLDPTNDKIKQKIISLR